LIDRIKELNEMKSQAEDTKKELQDKFTELERDDVKISNDKKNKLADINKLEKKLQELAKLKLDIED